MRAAARWAWHRWELIGPDGAVARAGLDVAQVAPDGRLRNVSGLFRELAAA